MMQWVPHTSLSRVRVLVWFYAEGLEEVLRGPGPLFLALSCEWSLFLFLSPIPPPVHAVFERSTITLAIYMITIS